MNPMGKSILNCAQVKVPDTLQPCQRPPTLALRKVSQFVLMSKARGLARDGSRDGWVDGPMAILQEETAAMLEKVKETEDRPQIGEPATSNGEDRTHKADGDLTNNAGDTWDLETMKLR